MGRAPCCEKMGLKKGPWTPQEDQILTSYIQQYGHGNWRALPKHAGLLRCGKSCRLRWTNYLRPDIKRGNFTREEEDAIINLHQVLGNRWSAIAARLPGRTDNEIKNVWHTHLKKRLHLDSNNSNSNNNNTSISTKTQHHLALPSKLPDIVHLPKKESSDSAASASGPADLHTDIHCSSNSCISTRTTTTAAAESSSSPQPSCSATSNDTLTTTGLKKRDHHQGTSTSTTTNCDSKGNNNHNFSDLLSEDFWAEVLSTDNIIIDQGELPQVSNEEHHHSPTSTNSVAGHDGDVVSGDEYSYYNNMDFYWYNLLTRAAETPPPPPPHEFMEF